jgi:hypothetical protein
MYIVKANPFPVVFCFRLRCVVGLYRFFNFIFLKKKNRRKKERKKVGDGFVELI